MEAQSLDFADSAEKVGFRLHRLEVFNWGTFHNRVFVLEPGGENSLLTGEIGSGKSTLVDAVTTLLVPPQRIVYNRAAGAEARERTLRSYVLGHYRSERGECGLASRSVALRDHNSYSVILARFRNEGYAQNVTLAQVFWIKDHQGQPARLYVMADRTLSIKEHFSGFGSDISALRKRLREMKQVECRDSFPGYGATFRRRFGIDGEQAMDLFNQTVSMKSVGNLTEFVRGHMLKTFPMEDKLKGLITHFDDLNRAHEAILKAKAQIEALTPLIRDADRHAERDETVRNLRACREALRPYFADLKIELLDKRLEELESRLSVLADKRSALGENRDNEQTQRDELKSAIWQSGGDRLERLKGDIKRLHNEKDAR